MNLQQLIQQLEISIEESQITLRVIRRMLGPVTETRARTMVQGALALLPAAEAPSLPAGLRPDSNIGRVYQLLRSHPNGINRSDSITALGIAPHSVSNALHKLQIMKLIQRLRDGRWVLKGPKTPAATPANSAPAAADASRKPTKEQIVLAYLERSGAPLKVGAILDGVSADHIPVTRPQVSTMLSKLKNENKVVNTEEGWRIA